MSEDMFKIDSGVKETAPSKYVTVEKEEDFVQENVYIKSLELSDDGRYYSITAEKNGQDMQTQRQYFPDRASSQSDDTYQKAVSIKRGLLANFMRKFLGEDAVIAASGWAEFVKKIDEACKPHYKTTPLRAKMELVENKGKYYTNISTFGPFELMTVPASESTLKITAKDRQMLRNKLKEESIVPDTDSNSGKDDDVF